MKFVNPVGQLITDTLRPPAPLPTIGAMQTRGMLRIGDPVPAAPAADHDLVFIAADTLLHAEETARELGLKPNQWRALMNAEDLGWHNPGRDARVVVAGGGSRLAGQIRAHLG